MDKEARIALLARAREAKQAKRQAMLQRKKEEDEEKTLTFIDKVEKGEFRDDYEDIREIIEPPKARGRKKQSTLELPVKEDNEVEETIRVKAPTKKKIIHRKYEVEESDTDEEVVEEVVRIPRKANEVKLSRKVMLEKLAEQNRMRLLRELFP